MLTEYNFCHNILVQLSHKDKKTKKNKDLLFIQSVYQCRSQLIMDFLKDQNNLFDCTNFKDSIKNSFKNSSPCEIPDIINNYFTIHHSKLLDNPDLLLSFLALWLDWYTNDQTESNLLFSRKIFELIIQFLKTGLNKFQIIVSMFYYSFNKVIENSYFKISDFIFFFYDFFSHHLPYPNESFNIFLSLLPFFIKQEDPIAPEGSQNSLFSCYISFIHQFILERKDSFPSEIIKKILDVFSNQVLLLNPSCLLLFRQFSYLLSDHQLIDFFSTFPKTVCDYIDLFPISVQKPEKNYALFDLISQLNIYSDENVLNESMNISNNNE